MSRVRKRKNNKLRIFVVLLVLVVLVFAGMQLMVSAGGKPVNPENTDVVLVQIPSGSSSASILNILEENDLVKSGFAYKYKTRINGYGNNLKAGTYALSQSMTLDQILDKITSGDATTSRFTIPEGYDLKRVAERLVNEGFVTEEDFWNEVANGEFDYWFLQDTPAGENRLEGFLFPDTYEVYENASAHDIIDRMLKRFSDIYTEEYRQKAVALNMTDFEVITLASIIEREAVVSEDRPIISSVFYNRMDVNMPLQSCATVQYILGEQKPRLSIKDTQIDDPYNTYIIDGLPPGPIGAPGKSSIDAALNPTDTNYIYFVAKGDGSHAFSEDYDQFLRDKAEYVK